MADYAVTLNVRGWDCRVVGGGAVAARKVRGLLTAGAAVTVVAPHIAPELAELPIRRVAEPYRADHLRGARLVWAATDDPVVNAAVVAHARAAGVLCGRADAPELGDLALPALRRVGPITLTVATGGAAPSLAARLADALESALPAEYPVLAQLSADLRPRVLSQIADATVRRELLRRLASAEAAEVLARSGPAGLAEWAESLLRSAEPTTEP